MCQIEGVEVSDARPYCGRAEGTLRIGLRYRYGLGVVLGLGWLCKQVSEVWSSWRLDGDHHSDKTPTVMTPDRYLRQCTNDPSGLGTDAQWTFSLVSEQLHRAPLSTTIQAIGWRAA